jgi:hypothetical protein
VPWQPFDTAPKTPRVDDRGPLILIYGERGVTLGYWRYGDAQVKGWWVDLTVVPSVPKGPTHWMPVPDAPGVNAEQ